MISLGITDTIPRYGRCEWSVKVEAEIGSFFLGGKKYGDLSLV
jgi:hypothetical protein